MKLIEKFLLWRIRRRELAHRKWLRRSKVYYIPKEHATPHHSCARNKSESL
jgi:hypothetical protein